MNEKKEKLKLYLISINYIYKMKKIIFYIYKKCWDIIANPRGQGGIRFLPLPIWQSCCHGSGKKRKKKQQNFEIIVVKCSNGKNFDRDQRQSPRVTVGMVNPWGEFQVVVTMDSA